MVYVVLLHFIHAYHHFVIVAHAHGFGDVPFHFTVHGMVEPRQPVGLVGEDTGQGDDDKYGNIFEWQFHVCFRLLLYIQR